MIYNLQHHFYSSPTHQHEMLVSYYGPTSLDDKKALKSTGLLTKAATSRKEKGNCKLQTFGKDWKTRESTTKTNDGQRSNKLHVPNVPFSPVFRCPSIAEIPCAVP